MINDTRGTVPLAAAQVLDLILGALWVAIVLCSGGPA
jgi:hypothetical protein